MRTNALDSERGVRMRNDMTWERRAPRRPARQGSSGLNSVIDSLNQMTQVNQQAMASMLEGVGQLIFDMANTMTTPTSQRNRPQSRHHRQDCDCDCEDCRGDCERDQCDCTCCIGDVDFVVYSQVGERRVVPIVVENSRRRDKDITLELSAFTSRGGKAAPVKATIEAPTQFRLKPC